VIINGKIVGEDGAHTRVRNGRVLKRS